MSTFSDRLGHFVGLDGPIQGISPGYANFLGFVAALVGALLVVVGWWWSAKRERRKYQLESAHSFVLQNNEKILKTIPYLRDYLRDKRPFPDFTAMEQPDNVDLHRALREVLNILEILALDTATGRAYEMYVRESQRTLICSIFILSHKYIESYRSAREQRSAFRNFERLFVRIYIKRLSVIERVVEYLLGRPIFRYSYFMFKVRYQLARAFFDLKEDFSDEDWQKTQDRLRRFRRNQIALAVVILFSAFAFYVAMRLIQI